MQLQIKLNEEQKRQLTFPDQWQDGKPFGIALNGQTINCRFHRLLKTLFIIHPNGVEEAVRVRCANVRSFEGEAESTVTLELAGAGQERFASLEVQAQKWMPFLANQAAGGDKKNVKKPQTLRSQITGKVLKILVSPGQEVKAGDALMIIEAMKMENKIFAKNAGAIQSIKVQEGALVASGDELLRFA